MTLPPKVEPCLDSVPPWVELSGWAKIRELVHSGRITAADGAQLLELRRMLAWRRRPWWDRLITWLLGGGP